MCLRPGRHADHRRLQEPAHLVTVILPGNRGAVYPEPRRLVGVGEARQVADGVAAEQDRDANVG